MTVLASFTAGIFFKARDYKMVLIDIAFAIYFAVSALGAMTKMC